MKKRNFLIYFLLGIIIMGILLMNAYNTAVYLQTEPSDTASVRFKVVNGRTNAALYNACVCIPEANLYFYTDNNGNTPMIEVPVIVNNNYDNIQKRNFGEITVIVYKEGYIDYILFNLSVKKNQSRSGIPIMMYEKQNGDPDYITIVESPDNDWVELLLEKYKKD